ncbi:50S ribosomal protein L25/general stress protein Ctc [Pseudorhodobacter sp.]|uniref:50S ribosomal protein L25/general stress protein Ctc n=1 Tax=Pseudorhodobacter sp. TaxID=1934400 RepID=UPI00264900DA|nr:50S ribosomal protein L25/general stress protein Ctc [Pseudorhodobacter sp.]MDN5786167.1 50S ribosomal protein L25/general stress protein Ctc [Pseudorhodobacter sp.]
MAKEIPDLVAEVRAGTGKGAARQARRDQMVPGVVYGDGKAPMAINMKYNYLVKHLKAGRFLSTLFNLKVEGEKDVRVICRDVQRHVVKDTPLHLDLMRLRANSRINLFIHVTFENHEQAPGLKKGGTLVAVRNEVELEVNASNIPDHLTVDLTGLNVGDVIHINDIKLPDGAKPTVERNFVIANISAPSSLRSAGDDTEGGDDEAAAEGAEA